MRSIGLDFDELWFKDYGHLDPADVFAKEDCLPKQNEQKASQEVI